MVDKEGIPVLKSPVSLFTNHPLKAYRTMCLQARKNEKTSMTDFMYSPYFVSWIFVSG